MARDLKKEDMGTTVFRNCDRFSGVADAFDAFVAEGGCGDGKPDMLQFAYAFMTWLFTPTRNQPKRKDCPGKSRAALLYVNSRIRVWRMQDMRDQKSVDMVRREQKAALEAISEALRCDMATNKPQPNGNAAIMREALKDALMLAEVSARDAASFNGTIYKNGFAACAEKYKKALEAPARNCDLYKSKDEAWAVFEMQSKDMWAADWGAAFAEWLLEEAKTGKKEENRNEPA